MEAAILSLSRNYQPLIDPREAVKVWREMVKAVKQIVFPERKVCRMSTSIFPPPADECSCLVDGCNWLDHGCCETKDLKDGEGAQAEVLVQCPRLLGHYREQHGITTAAAWRPSIFTFKVPKQYYIGFLNQSPQP